MLLLSGWNLTRLGSLHDPAATHHFVAAVKHSRLAGSDGPLRFVKLDAYTTIVDRRDRRGRGFMPVAKSQ